MQTSEVIVTLLDEHLGKQRFVYNEPWICMIGRADDCDIQIPSDLGHLQVSRHHCLLEIHPPTVRVRDLGSTNGTFVNGEKIGPRHDDSNGAATENWQPVSKELRQGDDVCLGHASLHLQVEVNAGE